MGREIFRTKQNSPRRLVLQEHWFARDRRSEKKDGIFSRCLYFLGLIFVISENIAGNWEIRKKAEKKLKFIGLGRAFRWITIASRIGDNKLSKLHYLTIFGSYKKPIRLIKHRLLYLSNLVLRFKNVFIFPSNTYHYVVQFLEIFQRLRWRKLHYQTKSNSNSLNSNQIIAFQGKQQYCQQAHFHSKNWKIAAEKRETIGCFAASRMHIA